MRFGNPARSRFQPATTAEPLRLTPNTALVGWSVQKAFLATLTGDSTLMGMVTGVFDGAPDGQPLPYVDVGQSVESDASNLTHLGRNLRCTVHVWSEYRGFKEAETLALRVTQLLDRQPVTSSEVTIWRVVLQTAMRIYDPDGWTRHIPLDFEVGVQVP